MELGFTFAGKSSVEMGLHYIPGRDDMFPSHPAFTVIDDDVTGRDGGYYYGSKVKIREFELPCYYEEIHIEELEAILRWVGRGAKGRLIFDDRPYVYYDVVSSAIPSSASYYEHSFFDKVTNLCSGKLTLHFKAYDPFGKMLYNTYESVDVDGASKTTGVIEQRMMPPFPDISSPMPWNFLMYNPGTETADTIIRVEGTIPDGKYLEIRNNTSGEVCSLVGLPEDGYLEINSDYGSVQNLPLYADSYAFEYHNDGYIRLSPCVPYDRDVIIRTTAGSENVVIQGLTMDEDYVGRYIYIPNDGIWTKIISVYGGQNCKVDIAPTASGIEATMVAVLNEVSVLLRDKETGTTGGTAELSRFEIEYAARTR